MKAVKGIREDYDLITEKEEADVRKLTSLVRAGLFDASKLPMIKRAMAKDPADMTLAERKALLNLLDVLMSEVLHSPSVYNKVKQDSMKKDLKEGKDYLSQYDPRAGAKWPSDKDMPAIIILKRKAIRVYPDQKKVGLYYSQALDKYVSIPFGGDAISMNESIIHINEDAKPSANNDAIGNRARQKADMEKRLARIPTKHLDRKGAENVSGAVTKLAAKKVVTGSSAGERAGAAGFLAARGAQKIGKAITNAIGKAKSKPAPEPEKKVVTPEPSSTPAATKPEAKVEPTTKTKKVAKVKAAASTPTPTQQQSKPAATEARPRQKMLKQKWRASMREAFADKIKQKKNDKQQLDEFLAAAPTLARVGATMLARTLSRAPKLPKGAITSGEKELAKDAVKIKPKPEPEVAARGTEVKPGKAPEVKPSEPTPVKTEPKPSKPGDKVPDTEAPAPKVEPKTEPKAEPKTKTEPKPETKPETKPKAKEEGKLGRNLIRRGLGGLAGPDFGGNKGGDSETEKKFTTPGAFSLKATTSRAKDFDANKARGEKERQKLYKEAFNVKLNNKPAPAAKPAPSKPTAAPAKVADNDDEDKPSTPTTKPAPEKTYSKPGEFSMKASTSNAKRIDTGASRTEKERQKMYTESTLLQLQKINAGNVVESVINIGSNEVVINKTISEKIISVYESLNAQNKKKVESMLNESVESFKKIVNFAVRQ
jgi:hypothetical protein